MAISLEEYLEKTRQYTSAWELEAQQVEVEIDAALEKAIATNIFPDLRNPNFVMRYKFSNKISNTAKDFLRLKYGNLGWTIKENLDFKDANVFGYFDFYKTPQKV
jgi:hypothetical protein